MGELRLRYVKLMKDFHTSMGKEDAVNLIKESVVFGKNLVFGITFRILTALYSAKISNQPNYSYFKNWMV